jgi:SAM-dependent methyltransferase
MWVRELLARHAPSGRLLDVGAGDGFVARSLHERGRDIVAVDAAFDTTDVAALVSDGIKAQKALPFEQGFSAVLLLDVLEHVDDDLALLREAAACIDDGGVVIVTVPAWPSLFSAHDRALGHRRRYTPTELEQLLRAAELSVVEGGGLFHALRLVRAVQVQVERWSGADLRPPLSDVARFQAPALVAETIAAALRVEQHLSRAVAQRRSIRHGLPGLSCFAVARVQR